MPTSTGAGDSVARFAGDDSRAFRLALWRLHTQHNTTGLRPSEQLGIDYPWVAQDLDSAAHIIGSRVKREFERLCDDERERRRKRATNRQKTSGKKAGAYKAPAALTDDERDAMFDTAYSRIVLGEVTYEVPATVSAAAWDAALLSGDTSSRQEMWKVVKPITGDPKVDDSPRKGARTVFDSQGRKRREYDATGRLVWTKDY